MEFQAKVEKSQEIAAQQQAVKAKMDGLIWKQHSQFPKSWTKERDERITALGKEYDRLGAEYRAVWSDDQKEEEEMEYAEEVMNNETNQAVLREFFTGIASGDYYDGSSYQLYLDTDDDSLVINHEASDNTWIQRDDGSLVLIERVSGYTDTPDNELYTEGCDLLDYGYAEWLDRIEQQISEVTA